MPDKFFDKSALGKHYPEVGTPKVNQLPSGIGWPALAAPVETVGPRRPSPGGAPAVAGAPPGLRCRRD